jgi:hypothetical protein
VACSRSPCALPAQSEAGPLPAEMLVAKAGLADDSAAIPASLALSGGERLPEGECVRLGAGLVECDLERPLAGPIMLTHELV